MGPVGGHEGGRLVNERTGPARPPVRTPRLAVPKILAMVLIALVVPVIGPQAASADAYGRLEVNAGEVCLTEYDGYLYGRVCGLTGIFHQNWGLEIVAYVNGDPRYRVRNLDTNGCLVGEASGGVRMSGCNSRYADQVWGFQYRYTDFDHLPRYWLRNKASGKCLVLNSSRTPEAFMYTCSSYQDQYWKAPGT